MNFNSCTALVMHTKSLCGWLVSNDFTLKKYVLLLKNQELTLKEQLAQLKKSFSEIELPDNQCWWHCLKSLEALHFKMVFRQVVLIGLWSLLIINRKGAKLLRSGYVDQYSVLGAELPCTGQIGGIGFSTSHFWDS